MFVINITFFFLWYNIIKIHTIYYNNGPLRSIYDSKESYNKLTDMDRQTLRINKKKMKKDKESDLEYFHLNAYHLITTDLFWPNYRFLK